MRMLGRKSFLVLMILFVWAVGFNAGPFGQPGTCVTPIALDFEDIPVWEFLSDQYSGLGVVFELGEFPSGQVIDQGQYGTYLFGNTGNFVLVGVDPNFVKAKFVDNESGLPVEIAGLSFRVGDGDPSGECLRVTARNLEGVKVFDGVYYTEVDGVIVNVSAALSEVTISGYTAPGTGCESGIAFDDFSFTTSTCTALGPCMTGLVDQNCGPLKGIQRAECILAQQEICKGFFGGP